MAKIMNWPDFQLKISHNNLRMFTPLDLRRLFGVSETAIRFFVHRYSRRGLIRKLRRGLYCLTDNIPSEFEIANRLYQPSYLSFDSALSYHQLIPETIYSITSATSQATREFKVNNLLYTYQKIKKEAYGGYRPQNIAGHTVMMAEPEKALADYLYFVDLKKRGLHYERLDLKKIKKSQLILYVKMYRRGSINQLVDQIYAEFKKPKRIY